MILGVNRKTHSLKMLDVNQKRLYELSRRNPDKASEIEALARRDRRFRSICEDYDDAVRASRHWASEQQVSSKLEDEFNLLAADLSSEALEYLDRIASGDANT